jgi:hemerythrin-like domain-containing protein
MEALECLYEEHRLIRDYLGHIGTAQARLAAGQRLPVEFFEQVVIIARQFVDRFHHDKEERQMFKLLAQRHGGAFDAQLEAIEHQHQRGRELVGAIADALDGYAAGDPRQLERIRDNVAGYAAMLAEHIRREDDEFFPLVRSALRPDEHDQLLVEFGRADEKAGIGFFATSRERVTKMGMLLDA